MIEALEDDLNTPKALAEMFSLARSLNKTHDADERQALAASLLAAGDLTGLLQEDPEAWFAAGDEGQLSAEAIEAKIAERNQARADKDFAAADRIRDGLALKGVTIEDGADGTRWRRS